MIMYVYGVLLSIPALEAGFVVYEMEREACAQ